MDAITLLRDDHKAVEQLFKRFEKAGDQAHVDKRAIVDQIIEELSMKTAAAAKGKRSPVSDSMKHAWVDVEERFSALGRAMKERYRAAEDEPEDDAPGGDDQDSGAAVRHAFERLVAAAREFGDRAGDVARDDAVKAQAKQTAASLNDALSATVNVIGEHVGGLFKRTDKGASEPDAPPPDATSASTARALDTKDPDNNAAQPDPDAPGTYVDDEDAPEVPEPNEPA